MLSSSRFCPWVILLYCVKFSQFTIFQTVVGVDPTFHISDIYDISAFMILFFWPGSYFEMSWALPCHLSLTFPGSLALRILSNLIDSPQFFLSMNLVVAFDHVRFVLFIGSFILFKYRQFV